MKSTFIFSIFFFFIFGINACDSVPISGIPTLDGYDDIHQETQPTPVVDNSGFGLSPSDLKTLLSLEQVDSYPLYSMHFYSEYGLTRGSLDKLSKIQRTQFLEWGCSLFSALADPENVVFGRNFDWEYSPAMVLFTHPQNGYSSISIVDLTYFGFRSEDLLNLNNLSVDKLSPLLETPFMPFDGMNEMGLAVGMAAVSPGNMDVNPQKKTIGSLEIIRLMLDHASNVKEAVALIEQYNIDFSGGPPLHYLIADKSGRSVLVEFYEGEMRTTHNRNGWQMATNFLISAVGESTANQCWRYDQIESTLSVERGFINSSEAFLLLEGVSQDSTQWSTVYNLSTGSINISMGRDYESVHSFKLDAGNEE